MKNRFCSVWGKIRGIWVQKDLASITMQGLFYVWVERFELCISNYTTFF